MINYTAIDQLFTTSIMQNSVVQAGHNFQVGNVLYYTGALYAKAHNDTQIPAQTVGIVSKVVSVNEFLITQVGFLPALAGPYTPGTLYYLDGAGNAGGLTSTRPSASGTWVVPLFIAITNTSGYYFNNAGMLIEPATFFNWVTISSNTSVPVNQGYIVNAGGSINVLLPAVFGEGDVIRISNIAGNYVAVLGAGITANLGDQVVNTSITSNSIGDTLEFVGAVANTTWQVVSAMGNLTYI